MLNQDQPLAALGYRHLTFMYVCMITAVAYCTADAVRNNQPGMDLLGSPTISQSQKVILRL